MANKIILFVLLASLIFDVISGKLSPTTININGKIYNCVNFYKQPAFLNPSIKLQVPNLVKIQQQKSVNGLGLKSIGCPIGTVPILDRSKPNVNEFIRPPPLPPPIPMDHAVCSARVQTVLDDPNNKQFFGVDASLDLYKLDNVQTSQWSAARIKLVNGADNVEAGWMVNPDEYEDNDAHLYGGYNSGVQGCFSMDCPGFVQVSTDIPMGMTPHEYSVIGGQKASWNISIDKHQDDGHWWLSITSEKHLIGYWPNDLFIAMKDSAKQVEFGGEVYGPRVGGAPTMGNGLRAKSLDSATISNSRVIDQNFNVVSPKYTEYFNNCEGDGYSVLSRGSDDARVIYYGGP
ncbi:protein neprosin-like [Silene latifolia]|uniref:protein neprosin-like n=1 Tax=Silene latifolia TaxID=37657 RepID=UPI003D7805FA